MRSLYISLIILSFLISCKSDLPHKYGVYVYNDESFTEIPANKTYKFNDWFDICGIGKPENSINNIDSVIIYFEKPNIDSLRLTKLKYLPGISVEGITHQRKWADVELWQAEKNVVIDIIPVKQKTGMYVIKPDKPLTEGVYALHFGILWNCEKTNDSMLNKVFSFKIHG